MKLTIDKQKNICFMTGLSADSALSIVTSTVSSGDMRDNSAQEKFLSSIGINGKQLILLNQSHSNNIAEVIDVSSAPDIFKDTDGIMYPGQNDEVYSGIFTADCMPVFITDRLDRVRCALHAGRAGAENGIIKLAIRKILKKNIPAEDISVFIMPHICPKCYPVDIEGIARDQISSLGIKKIFSADKCTFENQDLFFSYRRDKTPMRQLSILGMFDLNDV